MRLPSWLSFWRSASSRVPSRRRRRRRPCLEQLEDRMVPSTLTVLNNHDGGTGSLRDTLATAKGGDTIVFDPSLDRKSVV